jgi:predicted protein tyrosine phosphatase
MPTLHVCSLARLHETVLETRASHMVTLINTGFVVERPASIPADRHLFLNVSDIVEPLDGHIIPGEDHVRTLLSFVRAWDRANPLVFHCWAGVSRSTAAAYIAACTLAPDRDEAEIARALRRASPTATPNARFVALADDLLARRGRMVTAVQAIGRGAECMEGTPFMLKIERD